jgi:hypothetical protein
LVVSGSIFGCFGVQLLVVSGSIFWFSLGPFWGWGFKVLTIRGGSPKVLKKEDVKKKDAKQNEYRGKMEYLREKMSIRDLTTEAQAEAIANEDDYFGHEVQKLNLTATCGLMTELNAMGNWTSERVAKTAGKYLIKMIAQHEAIIETSRSSIDLLEMAALIAFNKTYYRGGQTFYDKVEAHKLALDERKAQEDAQALMRDQMRNEMMAQLNVERNAMRNEMMAARSSAADDRMSE